MKLYLGQSALRLTVKTFCNLRDVEKAAIRYRKSDGVMGEFPAVIRDEEGGVLCYECGAGDIDRAGWWSFWAFVVFKDGREAIGEAEKIYIWHEGT